MYVHKTAFFKSQKYLQANLERNLLRKCFYISLFSHDHQLKIQNLYHYFLKSAKYVPFVLSCFMHLSLHVLSYLTCFMPCVLSCVTCLVLYLLSFFTCLVLLVPSSLRTSISHMLYCVLYPSYLMHCFLHISITPFLLLSSYASNDFFMFISNSLAFFTKFKTVYMKIICI